MNTRLTRAQSARSSAGRRGQTLAEFAISLPILLLLLFGILEFGRLFQSWVTIQNAARAAARYAVTGAFNETKYNIEELLPCTSASPFNDRATYPLQPYTYTNIEVSDGDNSTKNITINGFKENPALLGMLLPNNPIVQDESLYATWYGVLDCEPNDDSLQRRKDLLRLPSIYDAARQGAAGIILDKSQTGEDAVTRDELEKFLINIWANPSPRQAGDDARGWFNVTICSRRSRLQSPTLTKVENNPENLNQDGSVNNSNSSDATRFHTFEGGNPSENNLYGPDEDMQGGACLLKERPHIDNPDFSTLAQQIQDTISALPNNYNRAWADAGSAGQRITIIITYNHPLITPLGLAEYIQIQGRRSAVNESFRVANAEELPPVCCTGLANIPTPTALPPTPVASPTNTLEPTQTASHTPTHTFTPTPKPFTCAELSAKDLFFDTAQTAIVIRFFNGNQEDTKFTGFKLSWDPAQMKATFPNAYFGFSSIDSQVHWQGNSSITNGANVSPLDSKDATRGDSLVHDAPPYISNPPRSFDPNNDDLFDPEVYRTLPGNGTTQWKGNFLEVTGLLINVQDPYDFVGTKFYFHNVAYDSDPTQPKECEIELQAPPAPPLPTPFPVGFTPSATFTPDCADIRLRLDFIRFDPAGDVRLRVTNNRPIPGYFTGFTINWPAAKIPGLRLSRVVVGGANASDIPDPLNNPGGTGQLVWSNPNGATTAPTNSANASSGTWQAGAANANYYIFPPNSITDIHLDFVGTGPSTLSALGGHPSDFNGTTLRIWCTPSGNGGGGGGGGGGAGGDITFGVVSTPGPTNTAAPTRTPGPTLVPSNTPTPGPPTNTWTPAPPTKTFTPSPTAQASNTPTRTPSPTPRNLGGADGG